VNGSNCGCHPLSVGELAGVTSLHDCCKLNDIAVPAELHKTEGLSQVISYVLGYVSISVCFPSLPRLDGSSQKISNEVY